MTTIAYRNGVLAADSQATDDGLKYETPEKIQRHGNTAYAVAGNLACGLKMIGWLLRNNHNPWCDEDCPLDDETVVVTLHLDSSTLEVWEHPGWPVTVTDAFAAWGSGAAIAIGAMAMGATAREAVDVAAKWDDGTGFQVRSYGQWRE